MYEQIYKMYFNISNCFDDMYIMYIIVAVI